jgi:hypothetical protein
LAIAAPAHARGDWRFRALPANRAAKTPTCHCHCALQGQERGSTSRRIVRLAPSVGISPTQANAVSTASKRRNGPKGIGG